jgi:aldose 1-epimerase
LTRIDVTPFGALDRGREAFRYSLTSARGVRVELTNFGGILLSVRTPDREGALDDVVLGYDDLASYVSDRLFHGCVVGRYANRVANGRLQTPEGTFTLSRNAGPHHIHGGPVGFHKVLWSARTLEREDAAVVELLHTSADGDQGYPGNLDASVTYSLTDEGVLSVDYEAKTDRPTVVNLTQHAYFNLAGSAAPDVLDHEVVLRAQRFTPVTNDLIPTGDIRSVAGTALDFSRPRRVGDSIDRTDDEQLRFGGGYDHNFVLDGDGDAPRLAARVRDPRSGRVLEVWTTEPGLQFYTGNVLPSAWIGRGGVQHGRRAGLCLETQHFPDSPNHPQFPSTLLRPGERYRSTTTYRFSVDVASRAW